MSIFIIICCNDLSAFVIVLILVMPYIKIKFEINIKVGHLII